MPKARFTTDAQQDLDEIVDYIACGDALAALSWLRKMRAVCDLIATQPDLGQRMHTARFGAVRRHSVGSYLVYYRPSEAGIDVVRVVHGAREQDRLM